MVRTLTSMRRALMIQHDTRRTVACIGILLFWCTCSGNGSSTPSTMLSATSPTIAHDTCIVKTQASLYKNPTGESQKVSTCTVVTFQTTPKLLATTPFALTSSKNDTPVALNSTAPLSAATTAPFTTIVTSTSTTSITAAPLLPPTISASTIPSSASGTTQSSRQTSQNSLSTTIQPANLTTTNDSLTLKPLISSVYSSRQTSQNSLSTTTQPTNLTTTNDSFTLKPFSVSERSYGSALVTSKMLFIVTPVPTEALVLNTISSLIYSRESQLSPSLEILNVTYENISDTSYVVTFSFSLSNISIPEDPELRNNTFLQIESIVNNALNTLLNDPNSPSLMPQSSTFTSTSNLIEGIMEYTFHSGDLIQPFSFLNKLISNSGAAVFTSGSALVTSKMLFILSSSVPSEALVLNTISSLIYSRKSQLSQSLEITNVTFEQISDTSFVVTFSFSLSNISIPEDPELRNNTFLQIESVVNNALNTLLNNPSSPALMPDSSNFTSTSRLIEGLLMYSFLPGDVIQPNDLLNLLLSQSDTSQISGLTTIASTPQTILGTVYIYIRLVFNTVGVLPSESSVLHSVDSLINSRFRQKRDLAAQTMTAQASLLDITYEKISNQSFALNITFEIDNVVMSVSLQLRNDTLIVIQDTINNIVSRILNKTTTLQFPFNAANFTGYSNIIQANVQYVFSDSDINNFNFVYAILGPTPTTAVTTPLPPPTTTTTTLAPLGPPTKTTTTTTTLRSPTKTTTTTTTTIPTTVQTLLGTVFINIRILFNTVGLVPSETNVLQSVNSMIGSRFIQKSGVTGLTLMDRASFLNVTYNKISTRSFALNFAFEIDNVVMSVKLQFRNDTLQLIQDTINQLVSRILNKTTSIQFLFNQANFMGYSNMILANVQYEFSNSDVNDFNLVYTLLNLFTTTTPAQPVTIFNTTAPNNSSAAWVVAIIVPIAIVIGLTPCWILLCCLLFGVPARIKRRWQRRRHRERSQAYNVHLQAQNFERL